MDSLICQKLINTLPFARTLLGGMIVWYITSTQQNKVLVNKFNYMLLCYLCDTLSTPTNYIYKKKINILQDFVDKIGPKYKTENIVTYLDMER